MLSTDAFPSKFCYFLLNMDTRRSTKKIPCKKESYKGRVHAIVPRAGVEPARVSPLVFETSASTDSAIWASKAGAKVIKKLEYTKYSDKKIKKTWMIGRLCVS